MPFSGIGFGEMLVIAMLVLIVFGPQRLPEITRSIGKAMREFKKGMNEIQRELDVADRQQRWASPTPAAGTPTATAAAAATAAGTASTEAKGAEGASGDSAGDDASPESGGGTPAPEPVIAPPTFGSDLPEEIEAQLAPAAVDTAVIRPKPEPEAPAAAAPAGDDEAAGRAGAEADSVTDAEAADEDPED
jgi:TatA/E family protein of Tat protein translocase